MDQAQQPLEELKQRLLEHASQGDVVGLWRESEPFGPWSFSYLIPVNQLLYLVNKLPDHTRRARILTELVATVAPWRPIGMYREAPLDTLVWHRRTEPEEHPHDWLGAWQHIADSLDAVDDHRQDEALLHLAHALKLWVVPETVRPTVSALEPAQHWLKRFWSKGWFGPGGAQLVVETVLLVDSLSDPVAAAEALAVLGDIPWVPLPIAESPGESHHVTQVLSRIAVLPSDQEKIDSLACLVGAYTQLNSSLDQLREARYKLTHDWQPNESDEHIHRLNDAAQAATAALQAYHASVRSFRLDVRSELVADIQTEMQWTRSSLDLLWVYSRVAETRLKSPNRGRLDGLEDWIKELSAVEGAAQNVLSAHISSANQLRLEPATQLVTSIRSEIEWMHSGLKLHAALIALQQGQIRLTGARQVSELEGQLAQLGYAASAASSAFREHEDLSRDCGWKPARDLAMAVQYELQWASCSRELNKAFLELQNIRRELVQGQELQQYGQYLSKLQAVVKQAEAADRAHDSCTSLPRIAIVPGLEAAFLQDKERMGQGIEDARRVLEHAQEIAQTYSVAEQLLAQAEAALAHGGMEESLHMLARSYQLLDAERRNEHAWLAGGLFRSIVKRARALVEQAYSPRTITRYGNVSFPGWTVVGRRYDLRVQFATHPKDSNSSKLEIEVPAAPGEQLLVDVLLRCDPAALAIEGVDHQTVRLSQDGTGETLAFGVTPKQDGIWPIIVEYFQDGRYIGRTWVCTTALENPLSGLPFRDDVSIPVMIAEIFHQMRLMHRQTLPSVPGSGPSPVKLSGLRARPSEAVTLLSLASHQLSPDLTILIDELPQQGLEHRYRFTVHSPLRELGLMFSPSGEVVLKEEPWVFLKDIYEELNRWHSEVEPTESVFFDRLNSLGTRLFQQLFPEELKQIYWKICDRVRTLQIITNEMWIPWEMIRPYRRDEASGTIAEDDFLCEKFNFTRWLAGYPALDRLELRTLRLVSTPSPGLDNLANEREALKRLPGIQLEETIPPSLENVYAALKSGGFQGLHFACHGESDSANPDRSVLYLDGTDTLSPNDISGQKRTFGKDKPLVFVNACETRTSGPGLTGLAGWAAAFIGAGASIFLGPAWEANDEAAYRFANEFYRNLLKGMPVGRAAQAARNKIKRAGDPTWLSYTVYGDPWATLKTKERICPKCERTLPYEREFCSDCGEVAPYLTQYMEVHNG